MENLARGAINFVKDVESNIGRHIDLFGINATDFLERKEELDIQHRDV